MSASVDVAERIFPEPVALDDPAETLHEASKLAPSTIGAQFAGAERLALDPQLAASTRRAARRHPHRRLVELPPVRIPAEALGAVLERRRSGLPSERGELTLEAVATLAGLAYGSRPTALGARRLVPSAGALYPLELYVLARSTAGLDERVFHYDPYAHRLEELAPLPHDAFDGAWYEPEVARRAAAVFVVTAVFARTRCKYDLRGYRFALLEAGHVGQNLLLAATALRRPALPYGGAYDRRLDELLGIDGVNESNVHVVLVS